MHFLSLLATGLLASSAVAVPTHNTQGEQGSSDFSGLTRKAVVAQAGTTPAKGKPGYTPAELKNLDTGDKFYKAALEAVGATTAPKHRRSPGILKSPAEKKLGVFGDAVLDALRGGNLPNNVVFVRQSEANHADTTSTYIGTVGLASCAALVYNVGSMVVLAHIYPAGPDIQTGAPAGNGFRYVSMHDQLARFWNAMVQAGLHGREPGGRWVFSQPVDGDNPMFADHQTVLAWVNSVAPGAAVIQVPFQWSETGGSQRSQSDLIPAGRGVVFAYHSKNLRARYQSLVELFARSRDLSWVPDAS